MMSLKGFNKIKFLYVDVVKPASKRPQIGFQDQLTLNAGQKYWEHFAILSTCIKLPFGIKIFILSIFEWLFYTCRFYCTVKIG